MDSHPITKVYNIHTLIKYQRFREFVKLSIVSHLLAPYPSRDMVVNEEFLGGLLGAYLAW